MDLQTIWFILVGVLLTGYAVLDGFDLGTGPLLLLTKEDRERRIFLNAIGPVWNGNEVWFVTGVGALFAAFPNVYATVLSGFYDAFMLLLFALIFRAVAIEFRSQQPGARWRGMWDIAFAAGSIVPAFIIGVAVGNLVWGIPLTASHEFDRGFFALLHPYAILTGVTAVVLMLMHANLYLVLKTEGALQEKLVRWTKRTVPAWLACFVTLNAVTIFTCPHLHDLMRQRRWLLAALCVFSFGVTFNIARELRRKNEGRAFISSCLSVISLMALFGATMFPNLVISRPDLANSLTIYNGSSTEKSLRFMFWIAMIGVPIVLTYTATIYYVFRGKVELTEESY